MLYIFIQGICFPIVGHDASTYAFYGKYLYQEKHFDNYPIEKADEETGAYLKTSHPPGFPLMLAVSVFYVSGLAAGIIVGAFALVGLMSAYLIQLFWLKGWPMPALPPIAFAAMVGYLVVRFAC